MEKTDALGRRVWDKAQYATLAAKRARQPSETTPLSSLDEKKKLIKEKRERLLAKVGQKERIWLEERSVDLDLEKDVGKTIVADAGTSVGYHCAMCECTLKDSQSYLDHLNGKRHNRLLGMSMRVEKKDVRSIKEKLKALKQKK